MKESLSHRFPLAEKGATKLVFASLIRVRGAIGWVVSSPFIGSRMSSWAANHLLEEALHLNEAEAGAATDQVPWAEVRA